MSIPEIEANHNRLKAAAIGRFTKTRKMGGAEFSEIFLDKLNQEIAV